MVGGTLEMRDGSASHLASLVLGDLVLGVLVALLALAVGPAGFGNVDLFAEIRELVSVRMSRICYCRLHVSLRSDAQNVVAAEINVSTRSQSENVILDVMDSCSGLVPGSVKFSMLRPSSMWYCLQSRPSGRSSLSVDALPLLSQCREFSAIIYRVGEICRVGRDRSVGHRPWRRVRPHKSISSNSHDISATSQQISIDQDFKSQQPEAQRVRALPF